MNSFGKKIEFLLKRDRKTQKELCETTGIARSTLSGIIKDKEPGLYKALAIATFFNVDLTWLISQTKDKIEKPLKPRQAIEGANEYSVSSDALYKRLREVILFTGEECFTEIMQDTPADFGVKLNALDTLVEVAKEKGFKKDVFWLFTGYTIEQWRETIPGNEMSKLLKKLEQLPREKLKLVKDLIESIK
jgi:transcriptional regulator with XRE-family HTH domain